ncbi:MAG: HAMP domain-containing histidine kinase, partial [Nitratireductor sp.]|nr:HAMP domain-containing histidine kinase [Nitratireductor sp.]
LIDDVLDLATIDAGAMVLDLDRVNFESVIEECIALQAEKLKRFHLKTGVFVDPASAGMIGDQARIRQVLQNLLANAVEAAPDGSTVCVEVRRRDGAVELSVQDEGPGIPENRLAAIFERFESGNGQKRGAGLGLAIVRSLVELHGGEVRIEQGEKRGARFVCVFPYRPVPSRQAAE